MQIADRDAEFATKPMIARMAAPKPKAGTSASGPNRSTKRPALAMPATPTKLFRPTRRAAVDNPPALAPSG